MRKKIYNKANSILELQGAVKKRNQILDKIYSQTSHIDKGSDPLLQKIVDDLFSTKGLETSENNKDPKIKFYLRDHVVEEMSRLDESDYINYLYYRYRYDTYPILHKTTKFPPVVQIEPASICNYRCVFCYQTDPRLSDKKEGHMGIMNLELFKNIIDQIEGNVEGITLASRGEPTVNNRLPEFLKYIAGKFLAAKINTNAYLLDEKIIHAILQADLQTLVFSVDATSETLYKKLRVNGSLDRVLKNIDNFHHIKESQYPQSRLITRISGVKYSAEQNMADMLQFWKKYVDQVAFVDYNPWENVYDAKHTNIATPCSDLWRRMFIWWDGKVAPCDVDYLTTLTNESLQQKTISDIWNGNTYQQLRHKHLTGNRHLLNPCSRCSVV